MPRVNWARMSPYVLIHLACLGALFYPCGARELWVFALTYAVKLFGVGGGYHRYFSHRSYKVGRVTQFALGCVGATALQNGPLWWAAHHRVHHRLSDRPGDPHSPRDGFWWSQVLWIFAKRGTDLAQVRDLARYKELLWLDRFNQLPALALWIGLYAWGGWSALIWGGPMSTVACWHVSSAVNSVGHRFGSRRFETQDDSRNNWALGILAFGDGWHNNHHHAMSSARHGFAWWEIDLTWMTLRALSWLGLVRDLKGID